MTVLSMPTSPWIRAVEFGLRSNTLSFAASLTPMVQTYARVGARWFGTYELPPMRRPDAEGWIAFLTALNGRAGRFYGGDPSARTPRGVATGTPVVAGASQTGTSLSTSGWTGGVTGILKTGDYVAWATPTGHRELHKLTADATSAAGGTATLAIAPDIRESPANGATVIVQSATCIMRLLTNEEAAWDVDEALIFGIKFSGEEIFPRGIF